MATHVEHDELSALASFVVGLARTVARDADQLHKAAAMIRQTRPENADALAAAALPELRHCCRALTDCVFRLRSAMPRSELEPDGGDAAPSGDAK